MIRRRRVVSVLILLFAATPLFAQSAPTTRPGQLFTPRDAAIIGAGTVGSAVVSLFDVRIARFFAESSLHAGRKLHRMAKRTSAVTETLLMISGGATWAIARLGHADGTADVALHTTESVASGAMFIQVIRGIAGRARPYVVDDAGETRDSDPYEFAWFKGFRSFNYRSFPSMHAMASFAAATALSEEMRVRNTPHRAIASPLLYLAASASPMARMYLDEHWASDIALGTFLGVFAGQKVVLYSHDHPGNPIDRRFLKPELNMGFRVDARGLSLHISPFSSR
jgi:membrane-associated phospholipid phosphatase